MTPTYDFECVGCHGTRQVAASIHDTIPDQFCEYDGCKMYKVFASPGVIFNARGFYKNGG